MLGWQSGSVRSGMHSETSKTIVRNSSELQIETANIIGSNLADATEGTNQQYHKYKKATTTSCVMLKSDN